MSNSEYYKDKICIVTGGNSGIGYALCEELLKRGAIVYMLGRNPQRVEEAAKQLRGNGDNIHTLITDVTVQEQVATAIKNTVEKEGRLDFLFNNAGIGGTVPFETATIDDWKTIIDVNLWSVIYGVDVAVPIMLEQGFGHIINTSSISGIVPIPFQALYSVTKFGVTALTECLKYEYAEKGLKFSTVCPANIATPIFKKDIEGNVYDDMKIPDDAYPVEKTAKIILDRAAEGKGVIVIPEENMEWWQGYVLGEAEESLMQMAHERRESYDKKGTYF